MKSVRNLDIFSCCNYKFNKYFIFTIQDLKTRNQDLRYLRSVK